MADVVIPLIDAVERLGQVSYVQAPAFEKRHLGWLNGGGHVSERWEWSRDTLEKLSQPELETLWMYTKPRWL